MVVNEQHSFEQNPFIVIWEITRTCKLKCLHCPVETQADQDSKELTFEEGISLIDEIAEMDHPMLIIKAGDVLLRSDFFQLAEHAIKRGLKVTISSSATPNVTKEVMKRAKEIGIERWAFSLDGPDAATQDALSGVPSTFELTVTALSYLKEIGLARQINTVVSKLNYDKIGEMSNLVKSFELSLWNIIMYVPTVRNKEISNLTASEYELFFQWLYNYSKKVPFEVKTTDGQHYRRVVIQNKMREQKIDPDSIAKGDVLFKEILGTKDQLKNHPYGINDGKGLLFISHSGDVFPSWTLPLKAGNVREESLRVMYRYSPLFKKLQNPDLLKGKCGICEYRFKCGGSRSRAYAVTGDCLESEPYCVYMPKAAYHHMNR